MPAPEESLQLGGFIFFRGWFCLFNDLLRMIRDGQMMSLVQHLRRWARRGVPSVLRQWFWPFTGKMSIQGG
jgi:hypothetical protein